jgi:ABC-type multidrug transport system ATPase subunit
MEGVRFAYPASRGGERQAALDGLDLAVPAGAMVGLVGPNGSGKSTAMRLMMGRSQADAGVVRVLGLEPAEAGPALWRRMGVVFQSPAVDPELTVMENLRLHGGLCGMSRATIGRRGDALLETYGLAERRRERVGRLSGGQRRRVELVKALMTEPELLLLDEPTAGLDPEAVRGLWDALDRLRAERGVTIVISTHLGDDAMRCDAVVLMDAGRALASGGPGELIDRSGGDVLRVETTGPGEPPSDGLTWRRDAETVDGVRWQTRAIDAPARVPAIAASLGDRLRRVSVGPPGLADVFASLRRAAEPGPDQRPAVSASGNATEPGR